MRLSKIAGGAAAMLLFVAALAVGYLFFSNDARPPSPASGVPAVDAAAGGDARGYLYGRVETRDSGVYEGRLRFNGDEEAFWNDLFNGIKEHNPWVSPDLARRLPKKSVPREIFGVSFGRKIDEPELSRPFVARFGDLTRIEAVEQQVRVTLKSGAVYDLDRMNASDFDDQLRVWDPNRGVVDLGSLRVRSITFLPAPEGGAAPRLHGTVRAGDRKLTGFVQWNRSKGVGSDHLIGREGEQSRSLPFDTVRSIERLPDEGSRVTLTDGTEKILTDTREVDRGNFGVFVDDPRYGRVLVSWAAFDRIDFSPAPDSGPGYDDFPPGRPLTGTVTTRDGRRRAGRLVYDLDESETVEALDAPSRGIDYSLPFGLIASITPGGRGEGERAVVALHDGIELRLEPKGDLGPDNGGLLVFADGSDEPEHVPWADVTRIDFDAPGDGAS